VTILILVFGLVFVAAGILVIRFAAPVASFFYAMGSPMFSEKLATRTYTPRNMRIAGVAWIAFGCLLLVLSALGFAGVIHPHYYDPNSSG
jgi:hypothetical protein